MLATVEESGMWRGKFKIITNFLQPPCSKARRETRSRQNGSPSHSSCSSQSLLQVRAHSYIFQSFLLGQECFHSSNLSNTLRKQIRGFTTSRLELPGSGMVSAKANMSQDRDASADAIADSRSASIRKGASACRTLCGGSWSLAISSGIRQQRPVSGKADQSKHSNDGLVITLRLGRQIHTLKLNTT